MLSNKKFDFQLFNEIKTMGDIGFTHYKVPDQLENAMYLADEMNFQVTCQDRYAKLLIDTYEDLVIEDVDM